MKKTIMKGIAILSLCIVLALGLIWLDKPVDAKAETTTKTAIEKVAEEAKAANTANIETITNVVPSVQESTTVKATSKVPAKPAEAKKQETSLKPNGGVADKVNSTFNNLPDELKACFEKSGWKIEVIHGELKVKIDDLSTVYGCTDTDKKTIYISDKTPCIEAVVHHEFGHYIDYLNSHDSMMNAKFQNAFNSERNKIPTPDGQNRKHCISVNYEYFATAFALWLEDPSALRRLCPETFKYIEEEYNDVMDWAVRGVYGNIEF